MTNPKFTGVWIPREVFQLESLSPTAKFVYGIVDSLDNEDGCYASNGYLAVSLGLADRQIRNLLKELDDANLIIRTEVNGHRVIRTVEKIALTDALTQRGGNKLPRGRQKIATGGGNKLPTYIKEDNIEDKDTRNSAPIVKSNMPFESKTFSDTWFNWLDYRKQIKKPMKPATIEAQWRQFILWGEQKSIDSIKQSITNGWTGLFEPKYNNTKQPLTSADHNNF